MTAIIHAYLRASTKEQESSRARPAMEKFLATSPLRVQWYEEKETGTTLNRPELMRLLENAQPGDVLFLEQIDRLTRLNGDDWKKLRLMIEGKGLLIVSMDLPTSHAAITPATDEFSARMQQALNAMMLEALAAMSRKDYEDRRRRQAEGIARAKEEGRYRGRPAAADKHAEIVSLRERGYKIDDIIKLVGMSRASVFGVLRKHKESQQ